MIQLLKEAAALKTNAEDYDAKMTEAKDIAKEIGKDCIVGGEFKIELKRITTKRVDTKAMPIEVRSLYEIETTQTRVEFVPLSQA